MWLATDDFPKKLEAEQKPVNFDSTWAIWRAGCIKVGILIAIGHQIQLVLDVRHGTGLGGKRRNIIGNMTGPIRVERKTNQKLQPLRLLDLVMRHQITPSGC
jgi:hypothetical protein